MPGAGGHEADSRAGCATGCGRNLSSGGADRNVRPFLLSSSVGVVARVYAGADAPPWRRIGREPLTRALSTYPRHRRAVGPPCPRCARRGVGCGGDGADSQVAPVAVSGAFGRYAGMRNGSQIPISERRRIPCGYVRRASAASWDDIHVKHLNNILIIGKTKDYCLGCARHQCGVEWGIRGGGARYAPPLRASDPRGAVRPCPGGAD